MLEPVVNQCKCFFGIKSLTFSDEYWNLHSNNNWEHQPIHWFTYKTAFFESNFYMNSKLTFILELPKIFFCLLYLAIAILKWHYRSIYIIFKMTRVLILWRIERIRTICIYFEITTNALICCAKNDGIFWRESLFWKRKLLMWLNTQ